jgi:phage terminase small subunit
MDCTLFCVGLIYLGNWLYNFFMAITDRIKNFIDEYLKDFNATQAAIRAGYSKKTAGVIGCENLKKPNIRKAIDERIKELFPGRNEIIKGNLDLWLDMREDPNADPKDKLKASEYLAKYTAMFEETLKIKGDSESPLKIIFGGVKDKAKD